MRYESRRYYEGLGTNGDRPVIAEGQQIPQRQILPRFDLMLVIKLGIATGLGWLAYRKTSGSVPWTAAAVATGYFVIPKIAQAAKSASGIGGHSRPESIEDFGDRFFIALRPRSF